MRRQSSERRHDHSRDPGHDSGEDIVRDLAHAVRAGVPLHKPIAGAASAQKMNVAEYADPEDGGR